MKPIILFAIGCTVLNLRAQAPQSINYQAVARNSSGNILVSQPIGVQISVLDGGASGTEVYRERHSLSTNQFGLFTLPVGGGSVQNGTFSTIAWGTGSKFLKVELDPAGGTSYTEVSNTQILSVPYALFANAATNASSAAALSGNINPSQINDGGASANQILMWNGSAWVPAPFISSLKAGNGINFSGDTIISTWTASGNDIYNNNTGNVGIGTQNPAAKMDITGAADVTQLKVSQNTTQSMLNPVIGIANSLGEIIMGINAPDSLSLFIGKNAGANNSYASTFGNIGIGRSAVRSNTTGYYNIGIGSNSLENNKVSLTNMAIGDFALTKHFKGNDNIALGHKALMNDTSGFNNTSIGNYSLSSNMSGYNNVAVGSYAGNNASTSSFQTLIGGYSGYRLAGSSGYNAALGYASMFDAKNSYASLAIGPYALYSDTQSYFSVAVGPDCGLFSQRNTYNVLMGYGTGHFGSNTSYNTYIGAFTGYGSASTAGSQNNAIGNTALYNINVGTNNVAMGKDALFGVTDGNYNIGIGHKVMANAYTNGNCNIGMGYRSAYNVTSGSFNTALGYEALFSASTSSNDIAIGNQALHSYSTNSGNHNIGIGYQAGFEISNSGANIAIGEYALRNNSYSYSNIAIGFQSNFLTTGGYNVAIGVRSLPDNTNGSFNTAVGQQAGLYVTGFDNTLLGSYTSGGNYSNSTAVGYSATNTASDQVRIGNSATTSIGGFQDWTNVSDARFKENIKENVVGLDFILNLRPVTYNLNTEKIHEFTHPNAKMQASKVNGMESIDLEKEKKLMQTASRIVHTGFIAQEVEAAAKKVGYDFSGVDAPKNENDHYGLRYAEFVVPMVKAIQEQQKIIENQKSEIDILKAELLEINKKIETLSNPK